MVPIVIAASMNWDLIGDEDDEIIELAILRRVSAIDSNTEEEEEVAPPQYKKKEEVVPPQHKKIEEVVPREDTKEEVVPPQYSLSGRKP